MGLFDAVAISKFASSATDIDIGSLFSSVAAETAKEAKHSDATKTAASAKIVMNRNLLRVMVSYLLA